MTVLHVERRQADPAHREAFDTCIRSLVDEMRGAPGFLWAGASVSMDDSSLVTVLGEWRTPADLDAFLAGARYAELTLSLDPYERAPASVRRFSSQ
jgi:quinol monooxygenase YgiN